MKKLTKANIETLAKEIVTFLETKELANSVDIYFNNKVIRSQGKWDADYNYISNWVTEEDVDPHEYFEYAAYNHILSMSFEGGLYDVLNYAFGRREEEFRAIFEKYGLYFELGNSWNLSAYPNDDDMEIEYTEYEKPKPITTLYYYWRTTYHDALCKIMEAWYHQSYLNGDDGCCVIGAGFSFEWEGDKYFMCSCSPYQGNLSWELGRNNIQKMLEDIGATNIYYNFGNMD